MVDWSNSSVRGFAQNSDPISTMVQRARGVVLEAVERGWHGPPFDPFELATLRGIKVLPREDVVDARIVARDGHLEIEFNPNKPRRRIRFSIAHELGHALFPDCSRMARHRGEDHGGGQDSWQVELLCNLAASEFLMPTGDDLDARAALTIDHLLELQERYDVSAEAVAIRLANLSERPCTVILTARLDDADPPRGFRVDYGLSTRSSPLKVPCGSIIDSAVLAECTAVGYTAKGSIKLSADIPPTYSECLGIPPYPGAVYPRVLVIAQSPRGEAHTALSVVPLRGDALDPRGSGPKIIAQLVNDQARSWGGGFAASTAAKYPLAHKEFQGWVAKSRKNLKLGNVHLSGPVEEVAVASLVAQQGYGPSPLPRMRYASLGSCFDKLSVLASRSKASVHMPRIGAGSSGGNWSVVAEMIDDHLVRQGIRVYVYTPPGPQNGRRRMLGGHTLRLDEAFPDGGPTCG